MLVGIHHRASIMEPSVKPDKTMRLTLERLLHPSAQDLLDLSKIWPAIPAETYSCNNESTVWMVARFNQRLLAGLELYSGQSQAIIRNIMVREPTRRRGIGRFMLEETMRLHPDIRNWEAIPDTESLPEIATSFLSNCGFRHYQGRWHQKV